MAKTDTNPVCEVCGATAYYSFGEHAEQPRCIKCEEVERSLQHYISHPLGLKMVQRLLRDRQGAN